MGLPGGQRMLTSSDLQGNKEFARLVIPVDNDGNVITGSSSSGISQAEVQAAIQAATNLANVSSNLSSIASYVDGLEAVIGTTADAASNGTGSLSAKLRQIASSFVTSGSTDTASSILLGGRYSSTKPTYTNGQRGHLEISDRGFLLIETLDIVSNPNNINAVDSASSSVTGQNNQNIITGNPSNNSTVSVQVSGSSSFAVLVTGTWSGTLQFERSLDNGVTWTSVGAFSAGTNFIGQTITANGAFHGNASSATHIRMRAIAWTSGVASVRILAGQGTGTITIGNPIRLFDSVNNTIATIKPGSVPAASTDTALCVTVRDFGSSVTYTETQLTAPGVTTARSFAQYSRVTCSYTVANINTSVTVRLEGRATSSSNWVNLAASRLDQTETANGTYLLFADARTFEDLRFNFVSEAGGTAATIDVVLRFAA